MTKPKTKLAPHVLVADPDVPPDRNGLTACLRCHLMGRPDDAHHRMPAAAQDVQSLAAGEKEGA